MTASPDVTVSTNLGPWVNRRKLFARTEMADAFIEHRIPSTAKWEFTPEGQHLLTAVAYDDGGDSTTSTAVRVTVTSRIASSLGAREVAARQLAKIRRPAAMTVALEVGEKALPITVKWAAAGATVTRIIITQNKRLSFFIFYLLF